MHTARRPLTRSQRDRPVGKKTLRTLLFQDDFGLLGRQLLLAIGSRNFTERWSLRHRAEFPEGSFSRSERVRVIASTHDWLLGGKGRVGGMLWMVRQLKHVRLIRERTTNLSECRGGAEEKR